MKRAYETVVIVDALLPDDQIESTVKNLEEYLQKISEVKKVDRRGKRRLSFEINKKNHGDYTVFSYDAEGTVIAEFERRLHLNEAVVRSLTVLREGVL